MNLFEKIGLIFVGILVFGVIVDSFKDKSVGNQEGGGIFGKKKAGNLGIMGLLVILIGSLMFSDCVI